MSGDERAGGTSETKIDLWEELGTNTLKSARECVSAIIENIRQQNFWPPTPTRQSPAWDPFAKLFFEDPEAAVTAPEVPTANTQTPTPNGEV